MAGFFLFYSLIWKYLEKEKNYHSLFNIKIGILFGVALVISVLDLWFSGYLFMYSSQIILFLFMAIISFRNYILNKNVYYFFIILMGLISWSLNAFAYLFLKEASMMRIYAYAINMIFFLFFLYGTIRMTKK